MMQLFNHLNSSAKEEIFYSFYIEDYNFETLIR